MFFSFFLSFSFILFIFFLSSLISITSQFFIWWSVFVFITLIALLNLISSSSSLLSVIVYFIVEESAGLVFLLDLFSFLQVLSLLLKGSFTPFHSWIIKVLQGCNLYSFSFLISIQKLPYFVSLSIIMNISFSYFLIIISWIPLIQSYSSTSSWKILFFISTSSSNLLLLLGFFFTSYSFFFFFSYLVIFFYLIFYVNNLGLQNITYELISVLVSVPLTIPFYVKLTILMLLTSSFFFSFLLVLSFFLNLMSGLMLLNNSQIYFFTSYNIVLIPFLLTSVLVFLL